MTPLVIRAATLIGLLSLSAVSAAQTGRQVLVLVNAGDEISVRTGDAYARSRQVPPDQIIRLTTGPARDEMSRADYARTIEQPVRAWFGKNGAQDRIVYLVIAKGVPLRIAGSGGLQGSTASVDSELTLLYRKMAGLPVPVQGRIDNPYFLGARPIDAAKPFSHESSDIFLVARLDGFSEADVQGLIARGKAPVSRGTFVLDMKAALIDRANPWLQAAADRLTAAGFAERVVLDKTSKVVTNQHDVLGYYSWGSNDPAIRQRTFELSFSAGALAAMFVSTDGRTFTAPSDSWQLGSWADKNTYYAGSPQSLAGDLIHAGVTGIAAHVGEPYLDATIRPEILFPSYVAGFNLVESFYLAMPYLSWQTVVVGDPLCAPFPRHAPAPASLEPAIDPVTDLPAFFSARRLAALSADAPGAKPEAVRLLLRGETHLVRGDLDDARKAFEEGTMMEPGLKGAQLALASLYEQAREYDKAIERYRRVVSQTPNDVVALNNLAFGLAARQGKLAEALPLAERAYTLSRGAPLVADTLGWVLHLTGDQASALKYLQQAVAGLPGQGEIKFHYAAVLAATGDGARAAKELEAALALDATLATREDVVALRKGLTTTPAKP
jgi:uncharacterized protein (TIGR03790 family)